MLRVLFSVISAIVLISGVLIFASVFSNSRAQTAAGEDVKEDQYVDFRAGKKMSIPDSEVARLKTKFPKIELSVSPATGAAVFIRARNNSTIDLSATGNSSNLKRQNSNFKQVDLTAKSQNFFQENAALFGISEARENLQLQKTDGDSLGNRHQTFQQFFKNVPVFAGQIKTHFDQNTNLYAVAGNVVPQIDLDVNPNKNADEAANAAIAKVAAEKEAENLTAAAAKLYVFHTNLAQGIAGEDKLVWEITVTNKSSVREFVYIDAHTGKFVEQLTGTPDALSRRAYNAQGSANPTPPNYPSTPFWVEGQPFPTGNSEADNMILSTGETYNFYKNAFGRDSYNGAGSVMDAIFNRGNNCPNASWDGLFISFCPGLTSDDVTAHEWTHAYTEYTDALLYAWQPGALNEGYSDVFGETVDRLNNRDNTGNSLTDPARTADNCTTLTPVARRMRINSPAVIAKDYSVGWANFGPDLTAIPAVTADVVQATDAADANGPATTDGCSVLTNAAQIAGKIALIDRGTCEYKLKVLNAQNAGAVGVIIANTAANVDALFVMPDDPSITNPINIPSVLILYGTATQIRSQLANGAVNVSLTKTNNTDASTRWLIGEDNTGALGVLRDMYNPNCYSNPGKVSDSQFYTCSTQDFGGIHGNSSVINHAYALLVDGGTYNGQTINAVGLTKAAHVYFRAATVYQTPISDFKFHADALEQSANDLLGVNLNSLTTGAPSGEIITAADIAQIQKAVLAVELRTPPSFCNFQPLLAKTPPAEPSCDAGSFRNTAFTDNFEGANLGWTIGVQNTQPGYSLNNWSISSILPDNQPGKAYFVPNPNNSCLPGAQDQTARRFLKSPVISLGASYVNKLTLNFDHWIATEGGYDGGQLLYSVNGGAFALVPQANYVYNAPNLTLASANNTNPQAGQRAWSGADGGSVVGSFGKTVVDLSGLASPGSTIQFRFDFGNDSCGGSTTGWYVDNVALNACFGPTAAPASIAGRVTAGGNRGIANATVKITNGSGQEQAVRTNSFGNFKIENLSSGATYNLTVTHKTYKFTPLILTLNEDLSDLVIKAK